MSSKTYTNREAVDLLLAEGWEESMLLRALDRVVSQQGVLSTGELGIGHIRGARAILRSWTGDKDLREAGLI